MDRAIKSQSDIRASKFRDILNFVPSENEGSVPTQPLSEVNSEIPLQVLLQDIHLSAHQPRRYFDPNKMQQMIDSIRSKGIWEPLLIRPHPKHETQFELVAGERRYRAAKEIGLKDVPVRILNLSDEEVLEVALVENLQREDLNPIEETEGILNLLSLRMHQSVEETTSLLNRMHSEETNPSTNNVISGTEKMLVNELFNGLALMGWQSFVTNRLSLLKLPVEILNALREGKIAYTKALLIARVKPEDQRRGILNIAISQQLSLNEIKEEIKQLKEESSGSSETEPSLGKRVDEVLRRFKKSKIWDTPQKKRQVERLLAEFEALMKN